MTLFQFLILLALSTVLVLLILKLSQVIVFAIPMLNGPVFVPSQDDKLETMLKLARAQKKDRIIDLGSGDGKVLLALAQQGYIVEGVEINPVLVKRSRQTVQKLGLEKKITITRKSFWDVDFSQYDLILFYGTTYVMKRLEEKLLKELPPGSRVVSNHFQFPRWEPSQEENDVRVYIK